MLFLDYALGCVALIEKEILLQKRGGFVLNNEMRPYLSVGVDVGADFSLMAIALPTQDLVGKTYTIFHDSQRSLDGAIALIGSLMKKHDLPARVFMESTGIYHFPMYYYMKDAGLDVNILNPLITHANKDINVRNVHNDRFDAQKIALLGLRPKLKTSIVPDDDVAAMRAILREYHTMKKELSMYICRLKNQLRQVFPQFLPIFSKVNGIAAMAILYEYVTPDAILAAGLEELEQFIKRTVTKGPLHVHEKATALLEAAEAAQCYGHGNSGICFLVRHYIEMIRLLDSQTRQLMEQIKHFLKEHSDSKLAEQVRLLQTIPGVGFLSAITLVCEIGDFSAFKRPKQLFAYFGLDPKVKQSGNYAGTDLKMSKRGSPFARRCIYMLALQSVSLRINGMPKNPVLRAYYEEKCKCKPRMTALGAVMHKVCNIIYAVLRDEKPFSLITPEEHQTAYIAQHSVIA